MKYTSNKFEVYFTLVNDSSKLDENVVSEEETTKKEIIIDYEEAKTKGIILVMKWQSMKKITAMIQQTS